MGSIPAVTVLGCTNPEPAPAAGKGKASPELCGSHDFRQVHTPRASRARGTHLCSSFSDTVTLRLCPRRKRAARMSAHCTISPRGPPFSTRGLKTSPDSSVRKPM